MKILHQFWPNQYPKFIFKGLIVFAITFFNSNYCLAQKKETGPVGVKEEKGEIVGVIESLQKLMDIHRGQYNLLLDQISRNPKLLEDLNVLKDVNLEPHFVSSLLFYSDPKYLSLITENECSFYALLKNNLLKTEQGHVKGLMVTFKNQSGMEEAGFVPKNDFFDFLYQNKCFEYKSQDQLFTLNNLKDHLKKITFSKPKNSDECQTIYKNWISSLDTPYLCGFSQIFEEAKDVQEKLVKLPTNSEAQKGIYRNELNKAYSLKKYFSSFEYTYINNLCQNLKTPEAFCEIYLSTSIWSKIINAEFSRGPLFYRCQALLNKNTLNDKELTNCANKFMEDTSLCRYLNSNIYPSLTPRPDCDHISTALKNSRLQALYQDCSGRTSNEGIINFFRVFSHLKNLSFDSNPNNCLSMVNAQFLKANKEADNDDIWKVRICYQDKILDKEVCLPTILGEYPESEFSEEKVIAQILKKTISTPINLNCHILNKSKFNPVSLEHKTGCFGLYDEKNCNATKCPKQIIYNEKSYGHLKYDGDAYFDFFPSSYGKSSFSMHSILKNQFRFKTNMIRNFTDLKYFFKKFNKMIVYGTGCVEDLLPSFFKKESFNQCRPTQFIIDGYIEENLRAYMIVRTALDDVHSPRIIPWPYVFTSVKSYQEFQPLKSWTMYGIH